MHLDFYISESKLTPFFIKISSFFNENYISFLVMELNYIIFLCCGVSRTKFICRKCKKCQKRFNRQGKNEKYLSKIYSVKSDAQGLRDLDIDRYHNILLRFKLKDALTPFNEYKCPTPKGVFKNTCCEVIYSESEESIRRLVLIFTIFFIY